MKNKIQVFGLRRSGTNLVEHLILKYFDKDYRTFCVPQTVHKTHPQYNKIESLKHTPPNLDYSEFAIIIFKPYNDWCASIEKRYGKEYNKESWNAFHRFSIDLYNKNPDKVIIIDWIDCAVYYEKFINHVSHRFRLPVNEISNRPSKKLDTFAGQKLMNEDFIIEPYTMLKDNSDTLKRLNKVKYKP